MHLSVSAVTMWTCVESMLVVTGNFSFPREENISFECWVASGCKPCIPGPALCGFYIVIQPHHFIENYHPLTLVLPLFEGWAKQNEGVKEWLGISVGSMVYKPVVLYGIDQVQYIVHNQCMKKSKITFINEFINICQVVNALYCHRNFKW